MSKVLIAVILLRLCKGNAETGYNSNNDDETGGISSLINGKDVRALGDSIVIVEKKNLDFSSANRSDCHDCGDFENYLRSHVLRIRSPKEGGKFYDFELEDLIPDNNKLEGRARRQELKKILLPILVALKLKSTVLVPIFLVFVALIAFKGFWAGITSLFVSKALALKVFYNRDNSRDHDFDDHDDYDDYGGRHRYRDHYDHQRFRGGASSHLKGRPVVVYLNGNLKSNDRYHEDIYEKEYDDDSWDSWKRNYLKWDRQKWEPSRPLWE